MPRRDIPIASEVIDLSSADHAFTANVQAIRANVTGTFYATLRGQDGLPAEASRPYAVAFEGQYVFGDFASVERATSDAGFQNATALLGVIVAQSQR